MNKSIDRKKSEKFLSITKNIVLAAFALIILVSTLRLYLKMTDLKMYSSIVPPLVITTIYFFSGVYSIRWAFDKPNQMFLMVILGGMFVRLMFALLLVIVTIKLFEINLMVYIFVLFFTYILYLILEIFYLNLNMTKNFKE